MPRAVDGWKVCTKCDKRKPVGEFNRNKRRLDGLHCQCKTCTRTANRAYRATESGRATIRAVNRRFATSEKGRRIAQRAGRRYRRTEKGRATGRRIAKRYQRTEKGRTTNRRYRRSEKGKTVVARRRALEEGTISDVTLESWEFLLAEHPVCNYCGHEFEVEGPFKRTLEHIIPVNRGGATTLKNLVYACSRCNSQKGDKLPEEWTNRWYEEDM